LFDRLDILAWLAIVLSIAAIIQGEVVDAKLTRIEQQLSVISSSLSASPANTSHTAPPCPSGLAAAVARVDRDAEHLLPANDSSVS